MTDLGWKNKITVGDPGARGTLFFCFPFANGKKKKDINDGFPYSYLKFGKWKHVKRSTVFVLLLPICKRKTNQRTMFAFFVFLVPALGKKNEWTVRTIDHQLCSFDMLFPVLVCRKENENRVSVFVFSNSFLRKENGNWATIFVISNSFLRKENENRQHDCFFVFQMTKPGKKNELTVYLIPARRAFVFLFFLCNQKKEK